KSENQGLLPYPKLGKEIFQCILDCDFIDPRLFSQTFNMVFETFLGTSDEENSYPREELISVLAGNGGSVISRAPISLKQTILCGVANSMVYHTIRKHQFTLMHGKEVL